VALKILVGIIVAVLMGGIAFGFYRTLPPADTSTSTQMQTMANASTTAVIICTNSTSSPQATVQVEVETTEASREQGLSGRTSLADGHGMLFVFDSPGNYGFWMKDMNFAIDMLFIDASGKIVTIAANASPKGYHQNPPQVFYPATPVQYVLEVPAGFAAQNGITEGEQVTFK